MLCPQVQNLGFFATPVKEGDKWRERRKGLGPFRQGRNDVAGLTVPAARRIAEGMKNEVKHEGADPIEDRRQRAMRKSQRESW